MIISFGPKKSRTKVFKIYAIILKKKSLAHFFPFYPLRPTSTNFLWGSTRYFGTFDASYKTNSLTTKRLLKTQIFEKKGNLSSEKILTHFISLYRVWQTSRDNLQGSTRCSDKCGSYRIVSVTPNMLLKTQIFLVKKRQPFQRKKIGLVFLDYRFWQTSEDNL